MNGINYYRLKQVDKDGNISYSAVVLIKNTGANGIVFLDVYPNPVKDKVKIKLASTTINKIDIIITDLAGRVIKQQPAQLMPGDNFIEMNTAKIPAGQYLVKLVCNNGCEGAVSKFVKE